MDQNPHTEELFEEANALLNIADRVEINSRIHFEESQRKIRIAELLREALNDSIEWPIIAQLDLRMSIGEHCGTFGIKTSSITCDRAEFERRKEAMEL